MERDGSLWIDRGSAGKEKAMKRERALGEIMDRP